MPHPGESETGLRKIVEFTRVCSLLVLLLELYCTCYAAFKDWKLTTPFVDRFLYYLQRTGLFRERKAMWLWVILLTISLVGTNGRNDEKIRKGRVFVLITVGILLNAYCELVWSTELMRGTFALIYIILHLMGYLFLLYRRYAPRPLVKKGPQKGFVQRSA